jgi:23S rRNA (uracil1939-C5)-methyltransferase
VIVELQVTAIAYGGDGVGRHEGLVVFVPLTAPGDVVRARIVERKPTHARAELVEILVGSAQRQLPPCPRFPTCGGCQLQHLTPDAQRAAKAGFVRDTLRRIAGVDWPAPIEVRQRHALGYRTRARLQCRDGRVGFFARGSHDVVDVDECPVLAPALNAALRAVRGAAALPDELDLLAGDGDVAASPPVAGLPAQTSIHIGGARLQIAPGAFFQANGALLDELVAAAPGDASGHLALDLYAGVGLFTLPLARRFDRVVAVESDPQACALLRHNVAVPDRPAVDVVERRVEDYLRRSGPRPDLVLLDPPRRGAPAASIAALQAPRVVYVACDPATWARDLRAFLAAGYALTEVMAFDLMPQTYHVEILAKLARG